MDIGTVRGLLTAVIMLLFVGIFLWSWSRRRKRDFDSLAKMPLEDDAQPPAKNSTKEQSS